jgi:hypothetical protein
MLFAALLSTAVAYQRRECNVQYLSIMENTLKKKKHKIFYRRNYKRTRVNSVVESWDGTEPAHAHLFLPWKIK